MRKSEGDTEQDGDCLKDFALGLTWQPAVDDLKDDAVESKDGVEGHEVGKDVEKDSASAWRKTSTAMIPRTRKKLMAMTQVRALGWVWVWTKYATRAEAMAVRTQT